MWSPKPLRIKSVSFISFWGKEKLPFQAAIAKITIFGFYFFKASLISVSNLSVLEGST